eukprot:gene13414-biopygen9730
MSSPRPDHVDPNSAAMLLLGEDIRELRRQHADTNRRLEEELRELRRQHAEELREVRQQLQRLQEAGQSGAVQLDRQAATEELVWAVCQCNDTSRAAAVAPGLLDRGADVHASLAVSGTRSRPALHTMISRGMVSTLEAVMAHRMPVDLTVLDASGRSPLHVLASACPGEDEKVLSLLVAILGRIRGFPELSTVLDWAQEGACRDAQRLDFLSAAAAAGRLSLLLPELLAARVPHYNCRPNLTLELKVAPQAEDWARLSDEHKRAFAFYRNKATATADLVDLLKSCDWKPQSSAATLQRLKELALLGADVMHAAPNAPGWESGPIPILTYFIRYGPMEVVECLLQTSHPIDFTVGTKKYGVTPLHYVTSRWSGTTNKTPEEVRRLLRLLLDHIEQHPQQDVVDWGRKNSDGDEPISWAARWGHLAPFVEVVFHERPVPYFTDHPGKIQITFGANRSDVDRLHEADLKRFDFTRGINENK